MRECKHKQFNVAVEPGLIDGERYVLTLQVQCKDCGVDFVFDDEHFAVSGDRKTLRYQIKPGGMPMVVSYMTS